MKTQEIHDVLAVSEILGRRFDDNAETIAALIDWKNKSNGRGSQKDFGGAVVKDEPVEPAAVIKTTPVKAPAKARATKAAKPVEEPPDDPGDDF